MLSKLYVVTALFNPWRYRSRKILYDAFRKYVHDATHCELYVGELAFGNRPWDLTTVHNAYIDDGQTKEFQWRTRSELWHKERMLNRLVQELPRDWEYVAWVDADVLFARPDWALEMVQMLQHYACVQGFSHAQNLGPKFEPLKMQLPRYGFVYAWRHGLQPETPPSADYYYSAFNLGHPGYCMGMRRDIYEKVGGFLDTTVLGSGDYYHWLACTGKLEERLPAGISDGYKSELLRHGDRIYKYVNNNIGYVDGLINHYFHGNRVDRRYNDRNQILINNQYDPLMDLKHDAQGMYQWTDRCPQLHYDCRSYFANRHEDSIDVF